MLEHMGKLGVIAGGVALVLAAGGGFVAYRTQQAQAAAAKSCEAITSQNAERGEVVTIPGGEPVTTIIGDSYTSGDGLEDYRDGWAYQFAAVSGAETHIAGVGQTGYVNGGFCGGQTFTSRLPATTDMLIIQGGLNDSEVPTEDLRAAATDLLETVADVGTVVLVGPVEVPGRDNEDTVDVVLSKVADAAGREYVSALDWEVELQPDGVHLSEKGAHQYATLLTQTLD